MADLILLCDAIITMDSDDVTSCEAIAVKADIIIAVGTREKVLKHKAETTQVVTLHSGHCILPGLIEPHTHPILCAQFSSMVDISGFKPTTVEEVNALYRKTVDETPEGQWIIFKGYNPMLIPGLPMPTKKSLDELSTEHPILIFCSSLHSYFANSFAFDLAGVSKETPDPQGGQYGRDENGELTGMIAESSAIAPFAKHFPSIDAKQGKELIKKALKEYAAAGITTIAPMGMLGSIKNCKESVYELSQEENCPVRVAAYYFHRFFENPSFTPQENAENFKWTGVKFFADGSPYGGTMATREPYLDKALARDGLGFKPYPNFGLLIHTYEDLYKAMVPHHKAGRQLATHAHGERAIDQTLDAYAALLTDFPRSDHRYRLEHCGLITKNQLKRATELGVSISLYIDHIYFFGKFLRDDILGSTRADRFMPVAEAEDAGNCWTLHADSPCTPVGPFRSLQTAVTRLTRKDPLTGRKETIGEKMKEDVKQALKGMTTNAAWQIFQEDKLGQIKVGYKADFTVIDRELMKIKAELLDDVKVVSTYKNGKLVK